MSVVDQERADVLFDVALAQRWQYLADYAVHRARKEHGPCRICKEPIEAGQLYVRTVWGRPWDREADIDDEGRPVAGAPCGEWSIGKEHVDCVLVDIRRGEL